jgi:hypothetical protein
VLAQVVDYVGESVVENVCFEELLPFARLEESQGAQMELEDALEHVPENFSHVVVVLKQGLILYKQGQLSTN